MYGAVELSLQRHTQCSNKGKLPSCFLIEENLSLHYWFKPRIFHPDRKFVNLHVSARFTRLQPVSLIHAWDAVQSVSTPSHCLATSADQYHHHHPPFYPHYSHPHQYLSLSLYLISSFILIRFIFWTRIILSLFPTLFFKSLYFWA